MIQTDSLSTKYQSVVRNATHELIADAPIAKGGGGMGFGAHEMLEASLATCLNMAIRMHAAQHDIPLEQVATEVRLTWPDNDTSLFEYSIAFAGDLSQEQQRELETVAEHCPVRQTLSKHLQFERIVL